MSDSDDYSPEESSGEEYSGGEESDFVEEVEIKPKPAAASKRKSAGQAGGPSSQPKRQRAGAQPKLTDMLQSASKKQLVELVLALDGELHLEQRVQELLPPPDISAIRDQMEKLYKKMMSSFPNARFGSNRDNYAYKRVGPQLRDLKAALVEQGRNLAECKQWGSLLEYLKFGLNMVARLPHWKDGVAGNTVTQQAANGLEALFVRAVKATKPSPGEQQRWRQMLQGTGLELPKALAAVGGR